MLITSKRLEGASTITQQVAKNFLLTNEVSLNRKIKEAILAFRIERALIKRKNFRIIFKSNLFRQWSIWSSSSKS